MDTGFIIALNGLKAGRSAFEWHADGEFFGKFENSEILDADLGIEVSVEKSGRYIGIDCSMKGTVTVACDRCLADLRLPVDTMALLSVKFGEGESSADEGGREILMLPETDTELDLGQIIYDYVCVALPMQRVHEDGGCDPEVVKYLSSEDETQEGAPGPDPAESPFAALKDIFGEK